MYVPSSFAETDTKLLHDFIEQHSFATLVSHHHDHPVASHLPLLLDRAGSSSGILLGHMARANPQWQHAVDQQVLVVFHGPHAYISPAWIDEQNVVPTWNYVAVHATGILRLVESEERLTEILQRTTWAYESGRPQPWSMSKPQPDYLKKMMAAIVGFEISIVRMEGKWKLSQNHSVQRRVQMIRGLRESDGDAEQEVATLMESTLADR